MASANQKSKNQKSNRFDTKYPTVSAWVQGGGYVEIGQSSDELPAFIKALDEGGMVWEGALAYDTMDDAFQALEEGLAAYVEEQGITL